ncbi:MAG: hypothetical protein JXR63_07780 [Spirochaetales bacterium]|nr:hypothetical protein [Spirochaetales bacterium]
MNKDEYLNNEHVHNFNRWLIERIDNAGLFRHGYTIERSKKPWQCSSIFDAFKKYEWKFTTTDIDGKKISGTTYEDSSFFLSESSRKIGQYLGKDDFNKINVQSNFEQVQVLEMVK